MKQIELTQGKMAIVDDADFARLCLFKWYAVMVKAKNSTRWYAGRGIRTSCGVRRVLMHSEILGVKGVDHADHDGLNNQRSNIRAATQTQNNQNRRKYSSSSRFKGVRWREQRNRWEAYITLDGKQRYLGIFYDENKAAKAYDEAAVAFGRFALTNSTL